MHYYFFFHAFFRRSYQLHRLMRCMTFRSSHGQKGKFLLLLTIHFVIVHILIRLQKQGVGISAAVAFHKA